MTDASSPRSIYDNHITMATLPPLHKGVIDNTEIGTRWFAELAKVSTCMPCAHVCIK